MIALRLMESNLIHAGHLHGVESMSGLLANSVVSGLWQGIALAAGAALCLRLVPRTTAAVRFAVWTSVFAVLALLPLFHAYAWRTAAGATGHVAVVHVDPRWSFAIALLWLAVSAARGVKLAIGAVRLRAIWKRAIPVDPAPAYDLLPSAPGLRRAQLCTSADVDRPSVIGFFSPRILIPESLLSQLTPAQMQQILLHEAGHLRRADDWINLLQKLSLALVPLNPVLVWIERRLCFERELACDDDVLLLTRAPKAYAECLTNLAEHRLGRRAAALSLGAWEKQSELGRRVHRILRPGRGMSRLQARVVMGTLAAALLGGATELSRCPQLVSFSTSAVPLSAAAQITPTAAYQPVVFHPKSNAVRNTQGTSPHEVLLKATMPVLPAGNKLKPTAQQAVSARRRLPARAAPALVQSRQVRTGPKQPQRWVVLTSWSGGSVEPQQPGIIFTVSDQQTGGRVSTSSYAAMPTEAGWLVLQL